MKQKPKRHRKLIDLEHNVKAKLEILAKKSKRDLKNYIEYQLGIIAESCS